MPEAKNDDLVSRGTEAMMMFETSLLRKLPPVSARLSLLLAATGILLVAAGFFAGGVLLAPAGLSFALGLAAALRRAALVLRGRAYAVEGNMTLLAATFVNGSAALFTALAAFILLTFGA
jgi:hypothetical protein